MADYQAILEDVLTGFVDEHQVTGVVAGLVVDAELVSTAAVGTSDPSGTVMPRVDQQFRIASMTKCFTAATVLSLRDQGTLQLDDPVSVYVPQVDDWFRVATDAPRLTLRHLLTMSGGMVTDDAWGDRKLDGTSSWLDGVLREGVRFAVAPGTQWEYSNLGFAVLGRAIATIGGVSYQEAVRTRLLRPLGLASTSFEARSGDAAMPFRSRDGELFADGRALGDGEFAPMGGLWSTIEDLAKWMAFMLDAFPPRSDGETTTLRRSSRREQQQMHRYCGVTTRTSPFGDDKQVAFGYGFGLDVEDIPGIGLVVGHGGGLPGFGSHMRWVPSRGVGVVGLCNTRYARIGAVTYRVLAALEAADVLPRPIDQFDDHEVRRAINSLLVLLTDWSDTRANALFADNVELDDDWAWRRREAERLFGGTIPVVVSVVATTGATAKARLQIGQRQFDFEILLGPTLERRIAWYDIAEVDADIES